MYAWVLLVAFLVVFMMIYPALILPLFNKFTPVTEGELSTRVAALLAKCGFKYRGLFVMDGSKRSSHGNAFFAGFGAGKRIVLFDTLLQRLSISEVEAVLAHELGHYKLHHIAKGIGLSAAMSLAGFWILGQVFDQPWFFSGLGVARPSMAAALALFLLADPGVHLLPDPLMSRYSRKREYEADSYAVRRVRGPQQALVKLYGQRQHADLPTRCIGVLRFAPAGGGAHRAANHVVKRVFGSYNQQLVHHAKNLLEAAGIPVLVRNQYLLRHGRAAARQSASSGLGS